MHSIAVIAGKSPVKVLWGGLCRTCTGPACLQAGSTIPLLNDAPLPMLLYFILVIFEHIKDKIL